MFKVECDSTNSYFRELEAPTSCLQWFTESFGSFSSFNFDATAYFAPDQVIFWLNQDLGSQCFVIIICTC